MITADSILEIFKYAGSLKLFGISLLKYLAFLLTFFSILLTKGLFRNLIKKKISLFFPKKDKDFLATFNKPINFLIFSIAFFISTVFLKDSVFIKNFINKINASLFTIIIFWAISKLIQPLFFRIKNIENIFTKDLLEWIISALKVILFILGFSAVLEIWGIKVAPIIAGLGLFGVAVALGAQDLFKNLELESDLEEKLIDKYLSKSGLSKKIKINMDKSDIEKILKKLLLQGFNYNQIVKYLKEKHNLYDYS